MPEAPSTRFMRAPEFPSGLAWLNTDRSLSLEQLQGKIVLLEFWNCCCIRCMHAMSDLKRLERSFAAELVVIGVHGGSSDTEKRTEKIRQAIRRQEIAHPVVNDRDLRIRDSYGVEGWPTWVLIDPAGVIIASACGDGSEERFEAAIREAIEAFDASGGLNRRPLAGMRPEPSGPDLSGPGTAGLLYPGKVLGDEAGGRFYIADSGRHRILEADLRTGEVRRIIGCGAPGLIDGSFRKTRFRNPQGMALRGGMLLVADAGNHAIREIDLDREVVRTAAGTGGRLQAPARPGVRWPGREIALSSPWDLTVAGDTIYIAMAGCHQIWRFDPYLEEVAVHAGSGEEGRGDGPHAQAALARPSGITTDRRCLYVADGGDALVRSAGLGSDGDVATLAGEGPRPSLRGEGVETELQHPLGIAWHKGTLYLADTCNNAVRVLDPATRAFSTLFGGLDDTALDEPGGVAVAGEHLFVADTNHHRVLRLRLDGTPTAWQLSFPERLNEPAVDLEGMGLSEDQESERVLPQANLAPGAGHFHFDLRLPAGYALNRTAPFELWAEGDGEVVEVLGGSYQLHTGDPCFPITIALQLTPGAGLLRLVAVLYYCEEPGERLCYYQSLRLNAPITVVEGARPEARVLCQVEIPSGPI